MYSFRSPVRLAMLLLGLFGSAAVASAQQPIPWMETPIVNWTNHFRQQQGRGTVHISPRLCYAARLHAFTMAQLEQMGHNVDGSTFVDRAKLAGYVYQYVGENVAYNEGYPDPAWKFFEGWMNSPSHWQNIQNPVFTEIGVGVYRSATGKYYACQMFGTPAATTPPLFYPLASLPRPSVTSAEPPLSSPARGRAGVSGGPGDHPTHASCRDTAGDNLHRSTSTGISHRHRSPRSTPGPGGCAAVAHSTTVPPLLPTQLPSGQRGFTFQPGWDLQHPEYYTHPWTEFPGW